MTPGPGFQPRPYWWEVSALTSALSLLYSQKLLCGSRKYPYLPQGRNFEILEEWGEGGQRPRTFQRGGHFQTGSIITITMFNFNLFSFSFLSWGHQINSRIKIIYHNLQIEDKCCLFGNQA